MPVQEDITSFLLIQPLAIQLLPEYLVNKDNLKYMAADHYVAGLELVPV